MHKITWDNVGEHTTLDGHVITEGLKVWNYNYEEDVVTQPVPYGHRTEPQWFHTEKGVFDGSRLTVRKPF